MRLRYSTVPFGPCSLDLNSFQPATCSNPGMRSRFTNSVKTAASLENMNGLSEEGARGGEPPPGGDGCGTFLAKSSTSVSSLRDSPISVSDPGAGEDDPLKFRSTGSA